MESDIFVPLEMKISFPNDRITKDINSEIDAVGQIIFVPKFFTKSAPIIPEKTIPRLAMLSDFAK